MVAADSSMKSARLALGLGVLLTVAGAATLVWYSVTRPIVLPAEDPVAVAARVATFVGAERCADCHAVEHTAWRASTHARAGGPAAPALVIAPFNGRAIQFADASVIPRVRAGVYEFEVRQPSEAAQTFQVNGVVGGGHIYGGGTQSFFTTNADGTLRLLPFEWSRQARAWFCNTNPRSGRGWSAITSAMRLAECGDWPPVRIMGESDRLSNCQSCHASQATAVLDTVAKRFRTSYTSLAINCESCHGPASRHVELAGRGALGDVSNAGFASAPLASLDKDASVGVCLQCHAGKDKLRDGFVSGDTLSDYYSIRLPALGDRPLHPDGRIRTFAYQEGHLYSDCYLSGGMTCVSCHDPHGQTYRDVWGAPLPGRFDDRQCTSCHVSKANDAVAHTRHPPRTVTCVACHMPSRQAPETRAAARAFATTRVVPFERSDHTISIPRPSLDRVLGMSSACSACHRGVAESDLEAQVRRLWGDLKPVHPAVAAQLAAAAQRSETTAVSLLGAGRYAPPHDAARFAGVSRVLEEYVRIDADLEPELQRRLEALASSADVDVRAAALAALHFARGERRPTQRFLASALRRDTRPTAVRARWSLALGFLGDRLVAEGNLGDAVRAYGRALDVQPSNARVWLSLGNAQRYAGDYERAVESYRRSLALDRAVPLTWVNLSIALLATADTASAITALTRATALNQFEPLAWFNLGNLAVARGDLERAEALYQRAATLDPGLVEAHFQLARVSLVRKDGNAALRHLRRGLAFDSSNASARAMAAELERRFGTRD